MGRRCKVTVLSLNTFFWATLVYKVREKLGKTIEGVFLNFLPQWGRENQVDLILEERQFLNEIFESHMGEPFSPINLLQIAACNIISTFIFGSRMEYDDPVSEEVMATFLTLNLNS